MVYNMREIILAIIRGFAMEKNLTGLILAGGLGTRLSGILPDAPKALARIKDRPFIDYLLDRLAFCGLERVIICTGYMARQIEKHVGESYKGMEIFYSREAEPLGTGGALRFALPLIESEAVLALNGDTYCSADIGEFYGFHNLKNACASMVLAEVESSSASGIVEIDGAGRIIRFREKEPESGPCLVNAGIYLIEKDMISDIPRHKTISLEYEIFPEWINRDFFGFECGCGLIDIGTPEGYGRAVEAGLPVKGSALW
jgi:D-glycero-alpha-D-manno-heptose 1-phosphate guanylyltransferase